MSLENVEKLIKDNQIEFIDLRFVDMRGIEQHVTFPVSIIEPSLFEEGKMFDGSSIAGWKGIAESDMVLMPDADSAYLDPFYADPTLVLTCDVLDPATMQGYGRCPRGIAKRAESYLKSSGIADLAFFGPEPEFFIFDSVQFANDMGHTFFKINSEEGSWNTGKSYDGTNSGYRPTVKGGYFPVPPTDSLHDIRAEMCKVLEKVGIEVEVHHHEVANAGQCEIGAKFNTLVTKADELQRMKHVIKNVAHRNGKTVTFMPKPLVGDNGSGMHVHQSLAKGGANLFSGDGYGGLSQMALWYIGGIFKHARAINAFTNSGTNSYKRLVPGFEAPVMLAYSARNRSASCRIPYGAGDKAKRVEFRFPDAMANPYLCYASLLMAGLDGIKNKIHPGDAMDKNLYDLPPAELAEVPTVCGSLREALDSLAADHDFLLEGGVFTKDQIEAYLELKWPEVLRWETTPSAVEFDMYYSA